jgi:hypothetical protein
VFVALIAIFHVEEDWRGRRAWNRYRREMEARGESLDLRSYIPKPVPDEENFCATPFLKSYFQTNFNHLDLTNDLWFHADVHITSTKDRSRRQLTDLVAWQRAFEGLQRAH